MKHEVATTHIPHVLRACVAFKMATNASGKRKTGKKRLTEMKGKETT